MDMQTQIVMAERRGEVEYAEILRQASYVPVSDDESLPVGQVLSYKMAAEAVRDCVTRHKHQVAS